MQLAVPLLPKIDIQKRETERKEKEKEKEKEKDKHTGARQGHDASLLLSICP